MTERTSRRSFLAAMIASGAYACVTARNPAPVQAMSPESRARGRYSFPQGLASGDPTHRSVVLWTRVIDQVEPDSDVAIVAEVSLSENFDQAVVRTPLQAKREFDHTIRLLVDGLRPGTTYYYRFTAGGDRPFYTGRTRTAPPPQSTTPFNFAVISCQNYQTGYFTGYRTISAADDSAAEADKLDFIVHVGDFIYEAIYDRPWGAREDQPDTLGPDDRRIPDLPSGGGTGGEFRYAITLEDYRHLYRHYLSDPDLQAARARWPFIQTWDDHEFTNDSWQGHDTYGGEGHFVPERKVAANQAWFEYIPALLSGGERLLGDSHVAHDFRPADPAFLGQGRDGELHGGGFGYRDGPLNDADAANTQAVETLTLYRRLRYGALGEFVITDNRSYRSDHAVPEALALELLGETTTGRQGVPARLVETCDAGRRANSGNPPATLSFNGRTRPNPRRNAPPGSLLGAAQKAWWKRTMSASDTRWRFWLNSVPLMPLRFDFSNAGQDDDIIMSADSWEGYPSERAELLEYLASHEIPNVISLSGDYHLNMAGTLDRPASGGEACTVGCEFAVAGISSTSIQEVYALVASEAFAPLITVPPSRDGAGEENGLNLTLLKGVNATRRYADAELSERARVASGGTNTTTARHLRYIDTGAYGYLHVAVRESRVAGTFIQIERPLSAVETGSASQVRTRVLLDVHAGRAPAMSGPEFTGDKPFPWSLDAHPEPEQ